MTRDFLSCRKNDLKDETGIEFRQRKVCFYPSTVERKLLRIFSLIGSVFRPVEEIGLTQVG